MKKLYFLSGLHRSGSTVLSSILNQNANIYCSPTSPLPDVLISSGKFLEQSRNTYTFNYEVHNQNLIRGILDSFYYHIDNTIIIDKHRGWPSVIEMLKYYYKAPKIICTNRKIPEIIASFINLIEKDEENIIDKELLLYGHKITTKNRANYIFLNYVNPIRNLMLESLKNHRECIHMVEYDDLISNPQRTMSKIYKFINLDEYKHNFDHIDNSNKENDILWGIKNLHKVRKKLKKVDYSVYQILGEDLVDLYSQFNIKYS